MPLDTFQLRRSATEPTVQNTIEFKPAFSRTVSFDVDARSTPATQTRWTQDLADRLEYAKRKLHHAQREWSVEQEEWLEEVEALRQIQKESHRFYKQRQKASRKEGRTFKHEFHKAKALANLEDSDDGIDADDEDDSQGMNALQRTLSALPGLALTRSSTRSRGSSRSRSRSRRGSQDPGRKTSVVQDLIRGSLFRRETT